MIGAGLLVRDFLVAILFYWPRYFGCFFGWGVDVRLLRDDWLFSWAGSKRLLLHVFVFWRGL